ncbi:MAG: hypothetical protein AABY33_11050 [Pseudomonadota bacterium]
MHRERGKGIVYSVVFHLLLLLLLIFGLPSILRNDPPVEPTAITVEILPITEKSNVKNSEAEKAEKPKPEPKEEVQKKPSPPVKTAEATPEPPEPTPVPTPPKPEEKKPEPVKPEPKPVPKPEPKKPEPKKDVKKPKPKEDSLDAILKAVKETAQKESKDQKKPVEEKTAPTPRAKSSIYDPSQQMSLSELDAIKSQFYPCWNAPSGAKNAHELIIVIHAEYNIDGSLIKAAIASESVSKYNSDSFYRAAGDAALRAVRQCTPLKNLSPDKYAAWRELDLRFNPEEMLQ